MLVVFVFALLRSSSFVDGADGTQPHILLLFLGQGRLVVLTCELLILRPNRIVSLADVHIPLDDCLNPIQLLHMIHYIDCLREQLL